MKIQIRPVITENGVSYYLMRKTFIGLMGWKIIRQIGYETTKVIIFDTPQEAARYVKEFYGKDCEIVDYFL